MKVWARSLEETFLPSSDIVEALREIAEQIALLRTDVQHVELEFFARSRWVQIEAARAELLNIMNIFEGHVTAWAGEQSREQYVELLKRARELLSDKQ